eukprot:4049709-Amphidinium_carterae.5
MGVKGHSFQVDAMGVNGNAFLVNAIGVSGNLLQVHAMGVHGNSSKNVVQETPLGGVLRNTKRDEKQLEEQDAIGGVRRPIRSHHKEPGLIRQQAAASEQYHCLMSWRARSSLRRQQARGSQT